MKKNVEIKKNRKAKKKKRGGRLTIAPDLNFFSSKHAMCIAKYA